MPKLNALPRPVGATVLSLLAFAVAAIAMPAQGLAAPAEGSGLPLVVSPSPASFPKTTVGNQSPNKEIDLGNEGEEGAWIEKVAIEGPDSAAFNLGGSGCNGAFLSQGQHCSVWISFAPGEAGEKHAYAVITFNGRPAESFELSGTAVLPKLTFAPPSHDFGLQSTRNSTPTTFQLTNSGEAGVQGGNFEIAGPGSNAFWTGSSDCWRWLEPGESCSMEVWFGPREAVAYDAELRTNANGSSFSAALRGEGGRANVVATENPIDFGAATVGAESATRTVTLTNLGNIPTGFFIGIVAGGDSGSFRLLDESCSGAELMPGGFCTAHVRFTPQSAGPKLARLAFFGDEDGGAMLALTGEGVAPAVTLAPSEFDFGSVAVGTASAPQSFAVRNEGSTSLGLGAVAIVGADLDQFSLAGDDCSETSLDPGDECVLRVRFVPDSSGAKTARLRVSGDAGSFVAALSGRGSGTERNAQAASQSGTAQAQALTQSPPVRRRGRGRHRNRFLRGDAVTSARAQRVNRGLRTSAVPR
jgi:hypothetical protein